MMAGFECWWTHNGSDVLTDLQDDDVKSLAKSFAKYAWESAVAEGVQSGAYLDGYEKGYQEGWQHQRELDAQLCEGMANVCDGYGKMFADAIRGKTNE